jgi:hypothetical protein
MTFRYDTSGQWLKGNTHLHSTASDGGKTFGELADLYASAGYDFLFRTDHWVASDTAADEETYPLLWLDGMELDGKDATGAWFHVVCLGLLNDVSRENGFVETLESARNRGALLIAAHPHWSGNTLDDCLRWKFDGIEVYNHVCHWLNGKSGGLVHWDAALLERPDTLALAVDDAHLKSDHLGWNGGWIVVNAAACSGPEILSAIRRGNFYSSCGPEIHSITLDGDQLHMKTSPVRHARLVGPGPTGRRAGPFDGPLMTDISMPVSRDWGYAYMEIEDEAGRRAWTNNLFTEA